MLKNIILAFVPIFFAMDAVGVLPVYISFTASLTRQEKFKLTLQAIFAAVFTGILFIFLGKAIFRLLGIQMADFMIAGGIILFVIAINDLLSSRKPLRTFASDSGIVPLGVPLIVGPGVLTTLLIIVDQLGTAAVLISLTLNVVLAALIFGLSHIIVKVLGESGTRALSKITSLLLASIAIMMVRKGIFVLVGDFLQLIKSN